MNGMAAIHTIEFEYLLQHFPWEKPTNPFQRLSGQVMKNDPQRPQIYPAIEPKGCKTNVNSRDAKVYLLDIFVSIYFHPPPNAV